MPHARYICSRVFTKNITIDLMLYGNEFRSTPRQLHTVYNTVYAREQLSEWRAEATVDAKAEARKAKAEARKAKTEETRKAKAEARKAKAEETRKAKAETRKAKAEETRKAKAAGYNQEEVFIVEGGDLDIADCFVFK
jgi:ATPase subunit of ABC transporter with duplicated ATPase domains